jgi:hypothetical protein
MIIRRVFVIVSLGLATAPLTTGESPSDGFKALSGFANAMHSSELREAMSTLNIKPLEKDADRTIIRFLQFGNRPWVKLKSLTEGQLGVQGAKNDKIRESGSNAKGSPTVFAGASG